MWNTEANTISISEGGNSCGYVNFNTSKFWSGGHCYTLKQLAPCINTDYLYFYLKFKQDEIMKMRTGTGLPNIHRNALMLFPIFYPTSLTEQRRIAAVLTAADDAIAAGRALVGKYEAVKAGLMRDLLGRGEPTKLRNIGNLSISGVDKHIRPGEIPVRLCNYMNVYKNRYITDDLRFSKGSVTLSEFKRFTLRDGDVIFTKDSETPNDIGIPAVVCGSPDDLVCGYHLAILRPFRDLYDGRFVMFALQTQACTNYFGAMANGITRFGMTVRTLENQTIFVPNTIAEQEHIAEILTSADTRLSAARAHLNKLENIKRGLMDDLLTGRVSVDGI
jgi:type I restriction enzyme S subunit